MASNSKVFKKFLGKQVNIIMKSVKGSQQLSSGDIVEGNVVMNGFLLDEDEEFFYLGTSDEEIDEALKKDDVVRIFLDNDNLFELQETYDGELN